MTQPHEVTVSDAEVARFLVRQDNCSTLYALQEFLAARVPDAKAFGDDNRDEAYDAWVQSHNALRAAVLRGAG